MKRLIFLLPFLLLAGCSWNVEFIIPEDVAVWEASDEANCLNWLWEWDWYYSVKGEGKKQMILTSVKKEKSKNFDIVSWTFDIVNIDWKKRKEHTFECYKDLSWDEWLWKNHGKLYIFLLDWDIKEQDIEGQPKRL